MKIARVQRADGAGILIGMTVDLLMLERDLDNGVWIEKQNTERQVGNGISPKEGAGNSPKEGANGQLNSS